MVMINPIRVDKYGISAEMKRHDGGENRDNFFKVKSDKEMGECCTSVQNDTFFNKTESKGYIMNHEILEGRSWVRSSEMNKQEMRESD